MKRVILVAAVSIMALASCKKDYTCECTSSTGSVTSFPIENSTKSDAEEGCDGTGASVTIGGTVVSSTTCKLK